MSEYTSDEQYQKSVAVFNNLVLDYVLRLSNFYQTSLENNDFSLSLAEVWFKCPSCDAQHGVEHMYLLQRQKETEKVVMQSLSTFFDVTNGSCSGVEAIFDLGATEVVMVCRECVITAGHDPDSVEIIEPEYVESKLV